MGAIRTPLPDIYYLRAAPDCGCGIVAVVAMITAGALAAYYFLS